MTDGYYTEDEYAVKFEAGANNKTYKFRITNAGTLLTTYSVTPSVSVGVTTIMQINGGMILKGGMIVK